MGPEQTSCYFAEIVYSASTLEFCRFSMLSHSLSERPPYVHNKECVTKQSWELLVLPPLQPSVSATLCHVM